jgi:hypothetical protein
LTPTLTTFEDLIVVVTGGRKYANVPLVFEHLDIVHEQFRIAFLAQGGARGADFAAKKWAEYRGVLGRTWDADWGRYGPKRAGPIRNGVMLREVSPDLLISFPGDSGTADCIAQARSLRIPHLRCA